MAKSPKTGRPEARLPKGFPDSEGADLRARERMLGTIREVFERYGFDPLDTPAIEYTEALGKFLPDQDRPNAGVFSFQDEDESWMSLRYDLTAPLARYVAENYDRLPKPFRRYATGPVWRNEKPGPGRFRQFTQFDADTVGTDSIAADAEMCMLAADTLEALGLEGKYVIKVNSRKLLDGLRDGLHMAGSEHDLRWLTVLRALDKLDRLGWGGVAALLGDGRVDESGDVTTGARLSDDQKASIQAFLEQDPDDDLFTGLTVSRSQPLTSMSNSEAYATGLHELVSIKKLCRSAGFDKNRIRIDLAVVRGLEYYTGPVFEAELLIPVKNEDGQTVRFGSVGGGGRYDDLIARFTGQRVPATGFSIGVSRLQAALAQLNKSEAEADGPVVVLVMEREELPRYQRMAQALRQAGIRAEMYLGTSGMRAQMKYADKRRAPCVVIQGGDERAKGEVQIKDLVEGLRLSADISDAKEWREARPAQVSVPEDRMVEAVREIVQRHRS